ncbi:uncharacterized protein LOC133795590 [Humulus lupulus]|uniref:uncharacterized protein LOC133795590 n=1 Tax=Humulus lupulus TaxID=3486 RepID=UPI002B40607F|nr:uncharacterized protein LOC133795590 [Humulus lupulus]
MAVTEERSQQIRKKMAVAEEKIGNISGELIQESLSLLRTVDVVRTCLLLKCWRHMCFINSYIEHCKRGIVDSVPVKSFKLEMMNFYRSNAHYLDKWLTFVVKNKVKELHICLSPEEDEDDGFLLHYYALPKAVDIEDEVQLLHIEAKNLEFLELVDVHFDKVNFSGCKKILNLSFSYVCDSSLDVLVTDLPLLENLTFNICSTLKDIKILS